MARLKAAEADVDENVRRVALGLMGLRGLTSKSDLAGPLGLSRDQVLDRFRGDTAFTVRDLVRMSEFFGVEVGLFVAGPQAIVPGQTTTRPPIDEYSRTGNHVLAAVGNLAA